MLLTGSVANPATAQNPDGAQPLVVQGRHGELLTQEAMGKYGQAAQRGNVFYMAHVIAGTVLPVNVALIVSKFTLWNPANSGKIVELIEFTLGIDSTVELVNGVALAWQSNVSSTGGGAPGTLTALVNGPSSTLLGSGINSVCKGFSAATLTNAAVLPIYPLGLNWDAVAAGRSGNFTYNFDGKFWVPPDTIITFVTSVIASTAGPAGLVWAEWLP